MTDFSSHQGDEPRLTRETIIVPKGKSHYIILKNHNIIRISLPAQPNPITKIGMSLGDPEKVGVIFSSTPDNGPFTFPLFQTSDLIYTSVMLLFESDHDTKVKILYSEATPSDQDGRSRSIDSWSSSYRRPEKVMVVLSTIGVGVAQKVDSSMVRGQRVKKVAPD